MKRIFKRVSVSFGALLLLILPAIVFADAGVPMIILTFPGMLLAFIPIVLIEASVLKEFLQIKLVKALQASVIANLVSTFFGFPLAWGILLGLELLTRGGRCGPGFSNIGTSIITVIVEAAWLCPHEGHLYWLIPMAAIISLIVAFFISVLIEYWILKKIFKNIDYCKVKDATWIANIASYAFLIGLCVIFLFFSIANKFISI